MGEGVERAEGAAFAGFGADLFDADFDEGRDVELGGSGDGIIAPGGAAGKIAEDHAFEYGVLDFRLCNASATAETDDAAVVHGVVERRARIDERIEQGDGEADRVAGFEATGGASAGLSVDIQLLGDGGIEVIAERDDDGPAFVNERDVGDVALRQDVGGARDGGHGSFILERVAP